MADDAAPGITVSDLLAPAACAATVAQVWALREHWLARQGDWMFTLGAATYLDRGIAYAERAAHANPILRANFGPLYDQIAAHIEHLRGRPAIYEDHLALPGFHIFLCRPDLAGQRGRAHIDAPHLEHAWRGRIADPFAFTIPLRLPRLGGGLNYWVGRDQRHLAYETGKAYLVGPKVLHQIANETALFEGDARITLQGHTVLCQNEHYVLFF